MAEDTGQERTEEATPRRREQARERGQVAKSRELNTMLMMLASGSAALFLGPRMVEDMANIYRHYLNLSRTAVFDTNAIPIYLKQALLDAFGALTPFFIIVVVAAVAGPMVMGGVTFSVKALEVKWEKLDPVKGLQRIFALRGLVELLKALVKFVVIASIAIIFLYYHVDEFLGLSQEPINQALTHAVSLLLWSFIIIASSLILIAVVDVPFQLWDHSRQLKMTRQEVKDESKDTEGNPELRARVRNTQREMAQRRMMAEIPHADVVVTNPEHYSVALKYDPEKGAAPIVVAKGVDILAMKIREIAKECNVPILAAPPLARALHHTTEIDQEIPAGLYLAVAKVLAYVFQLKQRPNWQARKQAPITDLPIPDDMQFD